MTEDHRSYIQPVREAVSYRGLFIAGWFGVREKHCSRLEIYDRLRASEQADSLSRVIQSAEVDTVGPGTLICIC